MDTGCCLIVGRRSALTAAVFGAGLPDIRAAETLLTAARIRFRLILDETAGSWIVSAVFDIINQGRALSKVVEFIHKPIPRTKTTWRDICHFSLVACYLFFRELGG